MELIELIITLVVMWIIFNIPEWRYNNYLPPEGQKINHQASMTDMTLNHLSKEQVMRNTVNGKYNVKK